MASLKPLLFVGISLLISENSASGTCESLRIVGGHTISIEDVPYMVSVFSGCGPICGGSIIDEWFILTAAHCFVGFPDNNDTLRVLYGTEYLSQGGDFINVTQRLCHDGFNGTEEHSPHDICILKLQKPIPIGWSSRISRVQLPSEDFVLNEDAMLNVSGWGLTKSEFMRNDLRQTTVPVVGEECCTRAYPNITPLLDTYICAGTRGHDACEGDSGGPLTYNNVQVGIASAARGCGYYPGLYTRVTSYLDWIYMTITII